MKILLTMMIVLMAGCNNKIDTMQLVSGPTQEALPIYDKQRFIFSYQGLKYTGEIMLSPQAAKGVIVIIPGHGPTDFVKGDEYLELRQFFIKQQYSVVYWDKAGTGLSEGQYDHNQSILSSAEEAIAAINAIQKYNLPNSDNLGFWSISRGGWIVPKISELYDGIKFWISVSGTTEVNNDRYMLQANLEVEQRNSEEIELLMSEWDHYQRILVRGGTLEEFNAKTKNLIADSYFNKNNFQMTEEILTNIQAFFQSGALTFEEDTNLIVMYPNLEKALTNLSIPVMVILGRLDSQIDWKSTGELYSKASIQGNMQLTPVYLDNCNHVMLKSETGGIYEELPLNTPACDGYYDAMAVWFKSLDIDK
ncbi:hypothetical protein [Marinicella sp. W31]|uniref:hypothetical protein n=1 Tax=Marinicella sp. W31 TaxID=3023713 RepID=UPI003757C9A0